MQDVRIASPMFLDLRSDAVAAMSRPGDRVIAAGPGSGDQTESLAPIHRELAPIDDGRVVLCDGRDLDPGERILVQGSGIRFIEHLHELNPATLPRGPLYVHFDSDIIDADEAPAFLYPAAGGPSADEMRRVLEKLMATGRVVAISTTVGWDVARDGNDLTRQAVSRALEGLQVGTQ